MSNTLIFDYAVGISEAQAATEVDYSFLKKCLVMVSGKYAALTGFSVVVLPTTQVEGETAQASILLPTPDGASLPTDITWSVSPEELATIDQTGLINCLANGEIEISCTDNVSGITETALFTITDTPLESFTVTVEPVSQAVGSTAQASISNPVPETAALPTTGTWSLDAETFATIDQTGLITCSAAGAVQVTYTDDVSGVSQTTPFTVTAASRKLKASVKPQKTVEVQKSKFSSLKTVEKQVSVRNSKTGKTTTAMREFIDPTQFKVVPIYDATDFAKYTDNTDVPFFMTGGLTKVYLLVLATEVDPEDENAIDFDPTDYFTLCFSSDIDIADAQTVDFSDFSGIKSYCTADNELAESLAKTDTAFLDENGSYAGCYEAFGRLLSQVYWRNCQYYVLDSDNPATTIKTVGEGSDLFDKRVSFFLNGSDGPTLGFFGNAGDAITTAYVKRLIRLQTQEAITSYIQINQPNNTSVQRINIEEAAADVILQYEGYPYFYLDSDVDNYINIIKSDETYFVNGEAAVKDAEPIWRAKIEVTEAQ